MNTGALLSRRGFIGGAVGVAGLTTLSLAGCSTAGTGGSGSANLRIMGVANEISKDV
jgi:hypothetical protein